MARIGVQLMTVREKVIELGVTEVLRRLAEAGLPVIEVSQVAMTEENVAAMERARGEHGLVFGALSGTMESARPGANPSLLDDYDQVVDHCRRLGASRVRIGMMPMQAMRGARSRSARRAGRVAPPRRPPARRPRPPSPPVGGGAAAAAPPPAEARRPPGGPRRGAAVPVGGGGAGAGDAARGLAAARGG